MNFSFMFFFLSVILPMVLLMMGALTQFYSLQKREKLSPFECGFDPSNSGRVPFSLRFFLLTVLFLIFDIEIVLIFPLPLTKLFPKVEVIVSAYLFLLILVIGLIHEWKRGALNWK